MGKHNGFQHHIFLDLVGTGFYHHDGFLGTRDYQVQVADFPLSQGGVDHELTVYQAYQHRGGGAVKGDVGDGQGNGGTDHGGDFRRTVRIHAHNGGHYLNIVVISFGEQGPDGPVDQTRAKNRLFAGPPFSFYKTSRNLTGSIHSFLIIHTQREKINILSWLSGCSGRDVDDGIAVLDHDLAVGHLAHLSDFQLKESASHGGTERSVIFESH